MAWIKVESSVSRNPKLLKAGPAASWLWLCGLAYAQEALSNGFIPVSSLSYLGVKRAPILAKKLVFVRLWEQVDGGFLIHDYLKHNRPADDIRRIVQEKIEGGKLGGRPQKTIKVSDTENHTNNPAVAVAVAVPSTGATGVAPGARVDLPRRQTLVRKRRLDAAFEGARVYVPQTLHADFMGLRQGAETELYGWYAQVADEWATGARAQDEPGADMFRFWRARYAEQWPSTASTSTPISQRWRPDEGTR